MEHVYAALLLDESDAELNERNLSAVLTAAGCDASESRTKALVAALEGVDVDGFGPDASGGSDAGVEPSTDGRDDPTDAEPVVEG